MRRVLALVVLVALALGSGVAIGVAARGGSSSSGPSAQSTQGRIVIPPSSTDTPPSEPLDISEVQARTVNITTTLSGGGAAAGTGMVITASGEVLTNNHVIQNATTITAQIGGVGATHSAHVLGYDVSNDVALLKVDGVSGLKSVSIGNVAAVSVGDPVSAVGNALGRGGVPTVTPGVITALNQTITAADDTGTNAETLTGMIQIQAGIEPGDSGGPLVNAQGQVIGITTAASARAGFFRQQTANVGFAIAINKAVTVAHQIESGRGDANVHVGTRGIIGVNIADLSAGAFGRVSCDTSVASGALVVGVTSGSPAATAGLGQCDVIVSVDGQSIGSASALSSALRDNHAGDKVDLGWVDNTGSRHSARVELIEGPPE
jgi:S1-C subfamily serine protease